MNSFRVQHFSTSNSNILFYSERRNIWSLFLALFIEKAWSFELCWKSMAQKTFNNRTKSWNNEPELVLPGTCYLTLKVEYDRFWNNQIAKEPYLNLSDFSILFFKSGIFKNVSYEDIALVLQHLDSTLFLKIKVKIGSLAKKQMCIRIFLDCLVLNQYQNEFHVTRDHSNIS